MTEDHIDIKFRHDQLLVTGEVEQNQQEDEVDYLSRGRRYGRFRRTLPLPEEVEYPDKLSAKFENGVLKITADLSEPLGKEEPVDVEIE